jgi:outer membrane lipopolysaccharide assembly protein LptE/RlpB
MMNHPYTEMLLAQQKQKEMLARAERERVVTQIIRWIRQDAREQAQDEQTMQTPEVSIYEN